MGRFCSAADSVCTHLMDVAGWFYGCSHRRKTFPITPRATAAVDRQPGSKPETYIVCLDCGRHFAYDWTSMRITWQTARVEAGPDKERVAEVRTSQ